MSLLRFRSHLHVIVRGPRGTVGLPENHWNLQTTHEQLLYYDCIL
jgi:hypothetical protein